MLVIMRERTTWNRNTIAAEAKMADDPRAMNQDHHSQQPSHEKYLTGGPSEFAEDVHPSGGTWKAEQAGGETKRNEIGMPEFRGDTFKGAALSEETALKKAHITCKVARSLLGSEASDAAVEKQAYDLMHLPDEQLLATYNRLAGVVVADDDQDDDDDQGGDDQGDDDKGQQQQAKQGGELPPALKKHMEENGKGKDQGDDDKGGGDKEGDDDKEAKKASLHRDLQAALASGNANAVSASVKNMVAYTMGEQVEGLAWGNQDQQGTGSGYAMDQQLSQQQMQAIEGMIQTAIQGMDGHALSPPVSMQDQQAVPPGISPAMQDQQAVPPGLAVDNPTSQQHQQQGMDQQMSDDQMLDQMLMDQAPADPMMQQQMMAGDDIQLDGVNMDIGTADLGADDQVLATLFNDHPEVHAATHAAALQGTPIPAAPQHGARTASTATVGSRPVGTNPTQGVPTIGGGGPAASGSSEVQKLSGLWASAPDVSSVFG